jgi:hypothetical protein
MCSDWVTFYDIFVRNALGDYRQLMKEIAYSPLMGFWLTFKNSKACASVSLPCTNYPDENFAREFMELFSIGLFKLNPDGTHQKDAAGKSIPTYDNHDIMSFARLWTGFSEQGYRSNIEWRHNSATINYVDPMKVKGSNHDRLPKMDLDDDYLGDRRPLCNALPARAFLRQGATYVYRGYKMPKSPRQPTGEHWNFQDHNIGSVPVNPATSTLFQQLCAPGASGACQFPSVVTLTSSIPCDGVECEVDTVRVIQIVTGGETVYYEYEHIECVYLAFYDNPKMIKSSSSWGNQVMCADPTVAAAGAACCASAISTSTHSQARCQYAREHVTYATAQARCAQTTTQYGNQYQLHRGGASSNVSDHMVSHGNQMYW